MLAGTAVAREASGPDYGIYAYTAREWDPEIGLYYYRARYYDSKLGRFVSEDPIGPDGRVSEYAYVNNAPTALIDPTGLFGIAPGMHGNYPMSMPWSEKAAECFTECVSLYFGWSKYRSAAGFGAAAATSASSSKRATSAPTKMTSWMARCLRKYAPWKIPSTWAPTAGKWGARSGTFGAVVARWLVPVAWASVITDVAAIMVCRNVCTTNDPCCKE